MQSIFVHSLRSAGLAAFLCAPGAQGQQAAVPDVQAQLAAMQRQLAEQRQLIEALARELAARGAMPDAPVLDAGQLDSNRGTGAAAPASSAYYPAPQSQADGAAVPATAAAPAAAHATSSAEAQGASPVEEQKASPSATQAASQADALATSPGPAQAASPGTAQTASSGAARAAFPIAAQAVVRAASAPASYVPAARAAAPTIAPVTAAVATAGAPARATPVQATTGQAGPVGRPPASRGRPPEVAPLFEQPGVLTPKGKFVFEPAVQFGYSSSNRVALVGYTIIPALLIGLVDVREVKRNTTTAILSGRVGLSNRLELDVKVPYVYRSDSTVSREIFTGTAVENVFATSGKGVGDAELGMRYQLNNGGPDSAFYVGSLRVKSRTGRDPFSVITDCAQRCVGPNASGTGLPLDLPTGSGFYSVQPGLTWLFPSDPAVFFGSVSYLHNLKRSNVSRTVLGGEQEFLGDVKPGDIVGFNFGMGLGLNEKASFSLGYDHSSIGRTKQNGVAVPGAVRTQLGTLLLGFSYRMSERRSLNVSIGAGLTRDTPDVTLTVRMPTTF